MWLAKKQQVKTRDDVATLAQGARALRLLKWVDWAKGEPRVISAWARAASLLSQERENWFMIPSYSFILDKMIEGSKGIRPVFQKADLQSFTVEPRYKNTIGTPKS